MFTEVEGTLAAAAFHRLQQGHQRFLAGQKPVRLESEELRALASGQHPAAAVLTCSDSRVVPEVIFDVSPGEIFTLRVAGAVLGPTVAGSIEYAIEHLHIPLVVVLGHTHCGAVSATRQSMENGQGRSEPNLGSIVKLVSAALEGIDDVGLGDFEGVKSLTQKTAGTLRDKVVKNGSTCIVAGVYDLESLKIVWV